MVAHTTEAPPGGWSRTRRGNLSDRNEPADDVPDVSRRRRGSESAEHNDWADCRRLARFLHSNPSRLVEILNSLSYRARNPRSTCTARSSISSSVDPRADHDYWK